MAADDLNARVLSVQFTEQYCGGAQPTDEMMEKMTQLRPYSNASIFISKFNDGRNFTEEQEIKLDKGGIATLSLDSGLYAVSFYQMVFEVEEEDDKAQPDKMQDVEEEEEEEEVYDEAAMKAECDIQWKRMSVVPLKIVGGKSAYTLIMNKECNPCEEPRP